MEPLQFSFCEFVTQQTQTFNIYYRTQSVLTPYPGFTFQTQNIYYRINNGPWIVAGTADSNKGPSTYVGLPSITVNVNDLVEYYFATPYYDYLYGYGNGGSYINGGQSSSTIINGTNNLYLNICSNTYGIQSTFCPTY